MIDLTPVESSRIAAIGYDPNAFVLAIKFPPTKKSPEGKTYHYANVAPEEFEELQESESKGAWFGRNIQNNPDHPFQCVDDGSGRVVEGVYLEAVPVPEAKELPQDEEGLKARALEVQKDVQQIVTVTRQGATIQTAEAFAQAGERLKQIVAERKIAQERVDSIKGPAYQTYKAALQLEKDVIGPYVQTETWLKTSMARYIQAEEAKRMRKEAELAAEARKQAEAEAKEKAVELAEHDAQVMEAQGLVEAAAQVRANPLPVMPARVAPIVLQKDVPKVVGVSSRKNWTFRITDESLLPREYLMPNESAIRQVVKALKDKTNIAGVEVYADDSVTVRA